MRLLIWQKQHLQMILVTITTNLAPGMIFGELSKTTQKGMFFLMPGFRIDYWADYGENLVVIGEAFSDATSGCSYLCYDQLIELNANKDKFKEIIGIGGGAGLHRNTIKAIDVYDLDYDQVTSSGPAMVASLEKAIRDKEWIVVTGWKPHFKWAQHDLKYLKRS
jgi:glycine betaine/proline transport system substrate-binding protein